jgi:hypothetical protein
VCDVFAVLTSKNLHTFLHSMPGLRMCRAIPPSILGFHDVRSFGFNNSLLSNPCISFSQLSILNSALTTVFFGPQNF